MEDKPSTFGLTREKLGKLWQLGKDVSPGQEDPDAEREKAESLQDKLAASLPLDVSMKHLLPDIFTVVCEKLKPFTGCSFKDLLLNSETDSLILEAIKDIHKKQAESAATELEKETSTVIYYAAIASSLVHHGLKITKLSHGNLSQSFAELSQYNWLSSDFKTLFTQAQIRCNERVSKQET